MMSGKVCITSLDMKKHHAPFDDFYDEFDFEREFFSLLKQAREKSGMSQGQLARKIDVKQSAISRLEAGRVNPTLNFLKKVILALNLKLIVVENPENDKTNSVI